ncbi:hypothetical protein [Effusibacillus consociatus]|uniref:B box-type domain-containing protein n=1 Tax=Effusibacillus consociatus TaxID=1117041 RepID=A0ABV9PW61_9BACL
MHKSLYRMKDCPTCKKSQNLLEWISWCSKCGMVVCSSCVHKIHECKDGYQFGVPGRGTRYFATVSLHETDL